MPESAQEWYARVSAALETDGPRTPDWPAYPLTEDGALKPLAAPADEPVRQGRGGVDCPLCTRSRGADPRDYIVWRDEVAMIGAPFQETALPLTCYLMPRRHADLSDLDPTEARRLGELLVLVERAARDVLDVPRVRVSRYGDGVEHLHWWVFARPTGISQLSGPFVTLWDDVLPARPRAELRRDLDLVAARLVELAGGEALPAGGP